MKLHDLSGKYRKVEEETMLTEFAWPAQLHAPDDEGHILVTFRDLPEAATDGADRAQALAEAADCLATVITGRIEEGADLPPPSPSRPGEVLVSIDPHVAGKAALYLAWRESNLSHAALAAQLRIEEKEIRGMLDPYRQTKLAALARALGALGWGLATRPYRFAHVVAEPTNPGPRGA